MANKLLDEVIVNRMLDYWKTATSPVAITDKQFVSEIYYSLDGDDTPIMRVVASKGEFFPYQRIYDLVVELKDTILEKYPDTEVTKDPTQKDIINYLMAVESTLGKNGYSRTPRLVNPIRTLTIDDAIRELGAILSHYGHLSERVDVIHPLLSETYIGIFTEEARFNLKDNGFEEKRLELMDSEDMTDQEIHKDGWEHHCWLVAKAFAELVEAGDTEAIATLDRVEMTVPLINRVLALRNVQEKLRKQLSEN